MNVGEPPTDNRVGGEQVGIGIDDVQHTGVRPAA